jgi:prepilin-type N-terminal cleavage/methylation domain-containing protein
MRGMIGKLGQQDERGFSLVEVLISMLLTLVVMAAVYGLLLRGQQAFQREPQVVDLQQNGRSALSAVSADVLQAGTGLPPEYPAFTTPAIDPAVGDGGGPGNPDVIEVVGNILALDQGSNSPETFSNFNGGTLTMVENQTNFQVGDLIVAYDNLPTFPSWWMGRVTAINLGPPVTLAVSQAGVPPKYSDLTGTSGNPGATPWGGGVVTRVAVVRYFAVLDGSGQFTPPPRVLMRQVDFGAPQPVAYIEDFQVAYIRDTNGNGDLQDEVDEMMPPPQKPGAGLPIAATDIVRSVRISVKARSMGENMQGSRVADGAQGEVGNLIRRTFSTMVNPRNIASGLGVRSTSGPGGPQYQ